MPRSATRTAGSAGVEWIAHPGSPQLHGLEVSRQAAADHRLAVDLDALPDGVHRVTVLLALPLDAGGPARFGAVASPFVAVTGLDGAEIATFTLTGLDSESAVAALELYRRQGAWKVRAVGQGYAGGLAAMLADQGVDRAAELAGTIQEAVARGLARSVAPPPRTPEGDRVRHTPAPAPAPGDGRPPVPQAPPATPPQPEPLAEPAAPGGPINYAHPRRRVHRAPAAASRRAPGPARAARPAHRR